MASEQSQLDKITDEVDIAILLGITLDPDIVDGLTPNDGDLSVGVEDGYVLSDEDLAERGS